MYAGPVLIATTLSIVVADAPTKDGLGGGVLAVTAWDLLAVLALLYIAARAWRAITASPFSRQARKQE